MQKFFLVLGVLLFLGCEKGFYLQTVRSATLPQNSVLSVQSFHRQGETRLSWPPDPGADSYELQYLDLKMALPTWVILQNNAATEYLFHRHLPSGVTERYRFRLRKWRGNSSFPWSHHVVGVVSDAVNDAMEPNDTKEQATPLSWLNENRIFVYGYCAAADVVGPYVYDADLDWYFIDVPPKKTVTFGVNNAPGGPGGHYLVHYVVDTNQHEDLTSAEISFRNSNATTRRFHIRFYINSAYYTPPAPTGIHREFGLEFSQMSKTQ